MQYSAGFQFKGSNSLSETVNESTKGGTADNNSVANSGKKMMIESNGFSNFLSKTHRNMLFKQTTI